LIVGGCRRHRLTGAGYILHFQIDLPAIARPEALMLSALQAPEVPDGVAFAGIVARPIDMTLPTANLLSDKLGWIEGRQGRRARNESCPAVRRFLLEHADPASASAAELELIRCHGSSGKAEGRLLTQDAVLDIEQCETLRRYAEAHITSVVPDTVDDLPEYQVNLTEGDLQHLVGRDSAKTLLRMPEAISAPAGEMADRIEVFLRKYSPRTRPFIAFHSDICSYTVNVALNDAESVDGGKLLVLYDGALREVSRRPGTATVHAGDLVHGVSRIGQGERYALILFFDYPRTPAPGNRQDSLNL
jgi:hypothetical protein